MDFIGCIHSTTRYLLEENIGKKKTVFIKIHVLMDLAASCVSKKPNSLILLVLVNSSRISDLVEEKMGSFCRVRHWSKQFSCPWLPTSVIISPFWHLKILIYQDVFLYFVLEWIVMCDKKYCFAEFASLVYAVFCYRKWKKVEGKKHCPENNSYM